MSAGRTTTALAQEPYTRALSYINALPGIDVSAMQALTSGVTGPMAAWRGIVDPVGSSVASAMTYNVNAANAANIATQNQKGALAGAGIGAAGNVAGGLAQGGYFG